MIWLYLILAIFILLILLILSPLHLILSYNENEGFKIKIGMLGFSFSPYSKPAKKNSKEAASELKEEHKQKNSGLFSDIFEKRGIIGSLKLIRKILNISSEMLKKAIKGIHLNKLKINTSIGASDAASAAIKYGQVSALLYPTVAFITSLTQPDQYSVNVKPNFLSEKISMDLELDISARTFYIIFIFLIFAKKYSELI